MSVRARKIRNFSRLICLHFSTLIYNDSDCSFFSERWCSISLCKLSVIAEALSKFGAGLFLLVQVIILLDCTHSWNDAWVEKDEQKWSVQVFRSYQTFFHCFLLASNLIFGMFLGILLYFRCQLYATL